ncbi:putative ATPase [Paraburkholderia bannensis]|uniref:Putative ATPase n=1 Tax=Paraburkholderia bannensis TaxID=765414 RepID=A0A7W9U493_9BURK|nr:MULTISPECIES: hypothetical protein [Paraburkholderia]MBB3261674.1 putative ATPase [Paraburkholderia sp. WP4_3_2]MBB6106704.1 putative ATPase [Paraburkholderia bannensis]
MATSVAALSGKCILVVLDNAGHVVDAVAPIVETLVTKIGPLYVLVTSRVSLRVMPETIYRVEPLDVPPPGSTVTEILRCSAVTLSYSAARDFEEIWTLSERTCISSARSTGCGTSRSPPRSWRPSLFARPFCFTNGRLPDRFTGPSILRAVFDWSFSTLSPCNRLLFRRLAMFRGTFTFDAMCAVVCDESYAVVDAINGITDLVAKSLVNFEPDGPARKYRLSQTTRANAFEKLNAEGEHAPIAVRHTSYLAYFSRPRPNNGTPRKLDQGADPQQWFDNALATTGAIAAACCTAPNAPKPEGWLGAADCVLSPPRSCVQ